MIRKILFLTLYIPILLNAQTAFISGNDTVCDNSGQSIDIRVDFTGVPPFTFTYSLNGIQQNSIITQSNPYFISTSIGGIYTLDNFNDANSMGVVSGSALITVIESPTSLINLSSDTLYTFYPEVILISESIGDIVSWEWNFGDNTTNVNTENAIHLFPDDIASYQISLIVQDINGCIDTAFRNVWVKQEYYIYIPTSFTPDNDAINDYFCIEYDGIRENTFLLKIYNFQGDLMYQSTNANELKCSVNGGWNGTHYKTGDLPMDMYIYEVFFQDIEGWKYRKYGNIFLIR